MSNTRETATYAWLEFSNGHLCGLCGNTGYIDTRGSAISPMGMAAGIRAYCICPNGRALKKGLTGQKKWSGTSVTEKV